MNIPQQNCCQQTKNLSKEIKCNSKNTKARSEEIYIRTAATLFKSSDCNTHFSQARFIRSKEDQLGLISKSHLSRVINNLIRYGLFEKTGKGAYKTTDTGKMVYDKGFKYHICRILECKRMGEDAIFEYISDMSNSIKKALEQQSEQHFSGCSYIEETKERILNISDSLFGSFTDHITKSPEERMKMNIKRRGLDLLGINNDDFEPLFAMIRRNVAYIKNKRWFDEFTKCIQIASQWLNYAREMWHDGEVYFSTKWVQIFKNKQCFASSSELHQLLSKIIQNNREQWEREFVAQEY